MRYLASKRGRFMETAMQRLFENWLIKYAVVTLPRNQFGPHGDAVGGAPHKIKRRETT
jgi:hypothetical protein